MKNLITIIAILIGILGSATGYTQAGILDDTFGNGGIVTTLMSSFNDFCTSAGLQSDGKIVLSGRTNNSIGLLRYTTDGDLDMDFGDSGMASTDLGTISDNAESMVIQPDGKIVVCGQNSSDIALLRYNSDGSPDNTFGGDGIVIYDIGSPANEANDVILQENGKFIVAGNTNMDLAVARFNENGSIDSSFAENGIIIIDAGSEIEKFHAAALQFDGKIVITGSTNQDIIVVRLESDGSLDNSFGENGLIILDIDNDSEDDSRAIAIQEDQKIVIAGTAGKNNSADFLLVRFLTNGSLDNTFGNNGIVQLDLATDSYDYARSLAIQSDGKLVVAGFVRLGSVGTNDIFAVARFNPDGSPDDGFGTNGKVFTSLSPNDDVGQKVLIQPDNKILVAGYSFVPTTFSFGFSVVRYHGETVSVQTYASDQNLQIYPNPNDGMFTVSIENLPIQKIELYTLTGKNIGLEMDEMRSDYKVDISSFPAGIYLAKVYTDNGVMTRKIVVH